MRAVSRLQEPHIVFIRLMPQKATWRPISFSHRAMSGGTARRSSSRCQRWSTWTRVAVSVPGGT